MGYFSTPCPVIKEVEIEYQLGDPGPVVREILSQIPARVKIDVVVPWSLFVRIYTRFMLEVGNGLPRVVMMLPSEATREISPASV